MTKTTPMRQLAIAFTLILGACASQQKAAPAPEPAPESAPQAQGEDKHATLLEQPAQAASKVSDLVTSPPPSFEPLYFAFNSDTLELSSRDRLNAVGDYLNRNKSVIITISGHCDDRGTAEYNLALGDRRARAAKDYLARLGVDEHRVQVVSYGSERPAVIGEGETVWAKNRRDEIQLAGMGGATEPTSMVE